MGIGQARGVQYLIDGCKARFFGALRRVAAAEESGRIVSDLLYRRNAVPAPAELQAFDRSPPYRELGRGSSPAQTPGASPVFVTGRFRSGSTLMWSLFRSIPQVTSYYEPFHERRWFDPAVRGTRVDPTHVGVTDYWAEYEGLEELDRWFSEEWKFRHLYMPAEAWEPRMQRYIEILIERSRGRAVLQFNAVDFRLPWLRARFPGAPILHIYRHPRDQWCSTLLKEARRAACRLREFESVDWLYLLRWARDLRHYFPFLTLDEEACAYELYYQVWRLSHLFGQLYADLSLPLEGLLAHPRAGVRAILDAAGMADVDAEPLVSLVKPRQLGKWREFAPAAWFAEIEARVDAALTNYAGGLGPSDDAPRREELEAPAERAKAG